MEQVANFPRQESDASPPILSPYLLLTFLLFVGLALAIFGMRALGQTVEPLPNPFAPFADVFPGQPEIAVEVRGFYCELSGDGDRHRYDFCALDWVSRPFSRISLTVSEGLVNEINFKLREDVLRIGDLMMMWDMPTIRRDGNLIYLSWQNRGNFAVGFGRYSLFLPVDRVTITEAGA